MDVSDNKSIGDSGFKAILEGISRFEPFQNLTARAVGVGPSACLVIQKLEMTRIDFLDLSDNEIGSRGSNAVCEAAIKFPHLKELRLNACAIGPDAAVAISTLLKGHQELRSIRLDNNSLGSEGAIEFCRGASQSRHIRLAHLGYNGIQSEEAARAISDFMSETSTLHELKLSGNHFDPKGAPSIGSAIEHSPLLVMQLEDMGFTEDTINDFLDHGVAETQDLQVMILSKNAVGDEGLAVISECLSMGLTDLSLSDCALTSESHATLLNLVSLSPNLRSLDLSNNDLGSTGLSDVILWMTQSLKESCSLRTLELANCKLGDEGFIQLASAMEFLTYLGVRKNEITSHGLQGVLTSNTMIQLIRLDLADNRIDEDGVHLLTQRFQQEHKRSLWNPRQLTSSIDEVDLSGNGLSDALAKSTDVFLSVHNPLLRIVW